MGFLMIRYKLLLIVVLLTALMVYSAAFAFHTCLYGCVECFFMKLVEQGVCVEIIAKSGGLENAYYQCDISKAVVSNALTEL